MDKQNIKQAVQGKYGEIARAVTAGAAGSCCGSTASTSCAPSSDPLPARPIGDRLAATTTASAMCPRYVPRRLDCVDHRFLLSCCGRHVVRVRFVTPMTDPDQRM